MGPRRKGNQFIFFHFPLLVVPIELYANLAGTDNSLMELGSDSGEAGGAYASVVTKRVQEGSR